MDEAFVPFSGILASLTSLGGDIRSPDGSMHMYVSGLEIETPVELDVRRGEDGALRIGTTPPLYQLQTSVAPSLHRLSFTAKTREDS